MQQLFLKKFNTLTSTFPFLLWRADSSLRWYPLTLTDGFILQIQDDETNLFLSYGHIWWAFKYFFISLVLEQASRAESALLFPGSH